MRGYVVCEDERLRPLEMALGQFIQNLETYARICGWDDLPHFYNERATVGFMAAACWQTGLISIEEYATQKGQGLGERKGRCDLWASNHELSWGFEAKQRFPTVGTHDQTLIDALDAAKEDAEANNDADLNIGLTFFTPSVPEDASREQVEELLRRMLKLAVQEKCHGAAWWFPEKLMRHPSPQRSNPSETRLWPGLLAVLKVASPKRIPAMGPVTDLGGS